MHPSIVSSPLPYGRAFLRLTFESCSKNDEGTNFRLSRMAQMRHLPKWAEVLPFTLPDLIYSWWGETQCNLCVISCILLHHTRKRKTLKITLTQPAAGETESNKPTSGQVREVHSFCVSPAIWLLATDAIARSTWRAYARTRVTQAEGKEIAGCTSTIGPLPHLV